jgi:hypothetical protein
MKEQGRMLMKGIDKGDVGVDSGSSLVGGTIAAMQGALDKGIHMLPESLQAKAIGLEEQAKLMLDKASDLAKPVVDSYQKEGVIAAAKTAGGLGAGAVSAASASASASAAAASTNIKASAADAAANLQQRAGAASTSIKSTASDLSSKASGAAAGLKQKITGASASAAAAGDKPKKQRRRRRGGRGHGNRKMKTREVIIPPSESIADTLGEKAKELKEVVVEQAPPSKKSTGAGDAGLIGGIRNKVAGVTSGISASASGIMSSASSTASGLVAGAQGKLNAATGAVKSTISGSGSSQKPLERKPSLQRRDELPALGTPQTPEEGSVGKLADGKLAAHPSDQSSLLDKAKFAVGGVVEATRDFVVDKLDNISMNADDTEPMSKEDKSALGKAKDQLHEMQQSIKK